MDRQLRRPAREAQRIRPVPSGGRLDPRGFEPRGRTPGERGPAAQDLVGVMFNTPKELRHAAEQHFGEQFVRTEVLEIRPLRAVITLRPDSVGPLVVYAERERHWYPFRIARVEPQRFEPRANGRPRLPHGYRISSRPRIDWL